ncbi:hypothetical protein, partial [Gallibacterium anatis]|uniref:hypothetical protein n=1 Tax=Gallibacterium anatis TaxID=750 RepID=UPI003006DF76
MSAEEAKNVNDLIAKAETAKEAAQQAVDGLPAGEYKTAKDGEVKAIDVPSTVDETTGLEDVQPKINAAKTAAEEAATAKAAA